MSRYLTPSKVSVLALIWLYSTSWSPRAEYNGFELVSYYDILSFVISLIVPGASPTAPGWAALQLSDFERILRAGRRASWPGQNAWDVFLQKIWQDFTCLDDLHSFFKILPFDVFAPTAEERIQKELDHELNKRPKIRENPISRRNSPVGLFVRRACLEFTRLQFDDTIKLWESFVSYRAPTEAAVRKRHPELMSLNRADPLMLHSSLDGYLSHQTNVQEGASNEDVERLLEYQIEQLQKYGNRVPEEMKRQFQAMVSPGISVPSLSHFVNFFDAWRAGDYTSAFDNLHRYFDYTMSIRDKTYYQYALLHMAVLQADFGCFGEAYAAMQETIATARENQDMSCLNFSLSWLYHLSKAYPGQMKAAGYREVIGSEREGLEFLESKARDDKMWSLLSSTLLSQTKLRLSNGDSISQALEHLYESSHLNLHHELASVTGAQMLMLSSVLSRLGLSEPAKQQAMVLKAAQAGKYTRAMDLLDGMTPEVNRVLKFYQYLTTYSGILKLKQQLHHNNIVASSHLLSRLKAASPLDPELNLELALLEVDYLIRQQKLPTAFDLVEDLGVRLKDEGADVYQRIRVLSCKGKVFSRAGKPEMGFSVALRAANASLKARIMPAAWEAVGVLCNILALEGEDSMLCAELFATQADAHMGIAGNAESGTRERSRSLFEANRFLSRAMEWYERVEDLNGQLEMLAKQAIICRLRGDDTATSKKAAEYVHLHDRSIERMKEESGPDSSFTLLMPEKQKTTE
ncbi:MAG: hypothetical protein Q9157_006524 [Trypethelium eluteriae]